MEHLWLPKTLTESSAKSASHKILQFLYTTTTTKNRARIFKLFLEKAWILMECHYFCLRSAQVGKTLDSSVPVTKQHSTIAIYQCLYNHIGGLHVKQHSFARDSRTMRTQQDKKTGGKLWVTGTTLALNIQSNSVMSKTAFFWVITQWIIVVISVRHFRTTYRSHLQG